MGIFFFFQMLSLSYLGIWMFGLEIEELLETAWSVPHNILAPTMFDFDCFLYFMYYYMQFLHVYVYIPHEKKKQQHELVFMN